MSLRLEQLFQGFLPPSDASAMLPMDWHTQSEAECITMPTVALDASGLLILP